MVPYCLLGNAHPAVSRGFVGEDLVDSGAVEEVVFDLAGFVHDQRDLAAVPDGSVSFLERAVAVGIDFGQDALIERVVRVPHGLLQVPAGAEEFHMSQAVAVVPGEVLVLARVDLPLASPVAIGIVRVIVSPIRKQPIPINLSLRRTPIRRRRNPVAVAQPNRLAVVRPRYPSVNNSRSSSDRAKSQVESTPQRIDSSTLHLIVEST